MSAAVGTFGIRPDEEENIFEFFGACCTARCAFVLSCQKRSLGICVPLAADTTDCLTRCSSSCP